MHADGVAALLSVTAGPDADHPQPDAKRNAEADPSADRPPDAAADSPANPDRQGDAPADRDATADITPEPPDHARFAGRQ